MKVKTINHQIAFSEGVTYKQNKKTIILDVPENESILMAFNSSSVIEIDGKKYYPYPAQARMFCNTPIAASIAVNIDESGYKHRLWFVPGMNCIEIANVKGSRCKDVFNPDKLKSHKWETYINDSTYSN